MAAAVENMDLEEEVEYEEIEEVVEEVVEEIVEEVAEPPPAPKPEPKAAPKAVVNSTVTEISSADADIDDLPFCEQCRMIYEQFTGDDGELGIEGLDRFVRALGQECTIQELRSSMAEWGDKKAGKMSFDNFLDMIERQQESWKAVDEIDQENQLLLFQSFKFFDANRDGSISLQELQTALELSGAKDVSEAETFALFRHADRNDDGAIDLVEWMMFMSDVDFSKLRR